MNKILTLCVLAISLCVAAQNDVKRIAIPEIADRMHSVAEPYKSVLRNSLTRAVLSVPGYAVFDRATMKGVYLEQQLRELVSPGTDSVSSAGKRLAQLSAVDYHLVTEVTAFPGESLMISARLVDIVSGAIENVASPIITTLNADSIADAGNRIVLELLTTPTE